MFIVCSYRDEWSENLKHYNKHACEALITLLSDLFQLFLKFSLKGNVKVGNKKYNFA